MVHGDGEIEPGFERSRRLVDVGPPEGQTGLETQSVPRGEATWSNRHRNERFGETLTGMRVGADLSPALAGVAGAGKADLTRLPWIGMPFETVSGASPNSSSITDGASGPCIAMRTVVVWRSRTSQPGSAANAAITRW